MTLNFLLSPDFPPEHFATIHMLNTVLQKQSGLSVHLLTPTSHSEQTEMLAKEDVTLVYANPFDAVKLIREHGYRAIVRPKNRPNEMVIASSAKGNISKLEDLQKNCTIALTDNYDVKLVGLRLLEAVDLLEEDIKFETTETYQAAARRVIQDQADAAFFSQKNFESMSKLTKSQLNLLIESDLADISHALLVKESSGKVDELQSAFMQLNDDSQAKPILEELGFNEGFEVMDEESAEFMIDLIETLLD